jgi:hypothetical protein
MRVERVVEVENPLGHMREVRLGRRAIYLGHGALWHGLPRKEIGKKK